MNSKIRIGTLLVAGSAMATLISAQDPVQQTPPAAGRGGRGGRAAGSGAFPPQQRKTGFTQYTRPLPSPDVLARGKALYEANCAASCHAVDMRGSATATNLLRSENTLQDKKGERVAAAIAKHTPPIVLNAEDSLAIAEYIHAIQATMGGQGSPPGRNPVGLTYNVLVGNAQAGAAFFDTACAKCHSPAGDLKGIGSKYPDPKELQNAWVVGSSGGGRFRGAGETGNAAMVTMADGSKLEGTLERKTDWLVILRMPDGTRRSMRRENDVPRVEVKDPNEAHKKMALMMDDPNNKNMHDITAYLATLK